MFKYASLSNLFYILQIFSRYIKDSRRRTVESVLEATGASQRTVDGEYDTHMEKLNTVITDVGGCLASVSDMLTREKKYFDETAKLACELSGIYAKFLDPSFWPNAACSLTLNHSTLKYYEYMKCLTENYRSNFNFIEFKYT